MLILASSSIQVDSQLLEHMMDSSDSCVSACTCLNQGQGSAPSRFILMG